MPQRNYSHQPPQIRIMDKEMKLTQKQETFCVKYFELGNATEAALIAGYSPKYAATHTTRWLNMANISTRLQELRDRAEDESVANVLERKQILTEIARGRVGNHLDEDQRIKQGVPLTSASIQELETVDVKIGKGENAKLAQITKIKLHNPTQAIDLLNKMDKLYTDGAMVSVDNRSININVGSEKAKELTERLIEGERTE